MPWKKTSAMDQRIQLIAEWVRGEYTKSELCRAYGISRPTADKWIARYAARGAPGLEEGSRAPHAHPNETPEALRAMIVATKLRHQTWGPKKVVDFLRRAQPDVPWPADSTAGALLQRAGEKWTRRPLVPWGGIALALSWGAGHLGSHPEGAVVVMLIALFYGVAFVLAEKSAPATLALVYLGFVL